MPLSVVRHAVMMGSEVSGGQQNVHSEHATLYIWDVAPIAFRSYRSASLGERGTRTYIGTTCTAFPSHDQSLSVACSPRGSSPATGSASTTTLNRRTQCGSGLPDVCITVPGWSARCGAVFHDEDEPAVDWRVVELVTSGSRIVHCVKLLRVGQSLHSLNMR